MGQCRGQHGRRYPEGNDRERKRPGHDERTLSTTMHEMATAVAGLSRLDFLPAGGLVISSVTVRWSGQAVS